MSEHGEIETKQLEIEDKQIELPKFYSYTGQYALCRYIQNNVDILKTILDMQPFRPPWAGQLGKFVRLRVSPDQLLLPVLAAVVGRH